MDNTSFKVNPFITIQLLIHLTGQAIALSADASQCLTIYR